MKEAIKVPKDDLHEENVKSVLLKLLNLFIPSLIMFETIDTPLHEGRTLFTHLT